MRIIYILPGPLSLTHAGPGEVDRRGELLAEWAGPGVEVAIRDVPYGPGSIESAYEEYISVRPTAQLMLEAEQEGFDAAILGCFGDPGLDAMRELLTRMVVVGPAESSCYAGLMLGQELGIITITQSIVRPMRELMGRLGIAARVAGIEVVDTPVLELYDRDRSVARAIEAGRVLVEQRGADVLILGCMTMAYLDIGREVEAELGVPVVNPVRIAVRTAEALVGAQLRHSKRAYPLPPKLADQPGFQLADFVLGQ
jgi:allantoin racemase